MSKKFSAKNRAILLLLLLSLVTSCLFAGCENPGVENVSPIPTMAATVEPTLEPSASLTPGATLEPTLEATYKPTQEPTMGSTSKPTPTDAGKTLEPTQEPTQEPTPTPTISADEPTLIPTMPTDEPAATPTQKPTATPTQKPTATPTQKPTATPTQKPTATPTQKPTATPTQKPTATPTQKPTATPTQKPTATPTQKPTATPTQKPTATPTQKPTATPTQKPTPTIPLTAISQEDYYARQWLSKQNNSVKLLRLYDSFVSSAEALLNKVELDNNTRVNEQEFNTVLHCYLVDYPQHFWVSKSMEYQVLSNMVISYVMHYEMTGNTQKQALNKFNEQTREILNGLNGNMSEYEREKRIHDYLVLNCTYNKNTDFCHTAYGALVRGEAVCDGYTKAFQYLCREAGIQTSMVEGKSVNLSTNTFENHAWNFIKINGNYYFMDVTWDDAGEPDTEEMIHYMYFNCTLETMNSDHRISDSYDYPVPDVPACTATKDNYYIKNNAVLEAFNAKDIANCATKKGSSYICKFLYLGNEDLSAWLNAHFKDINTALGANIRGASAVIVANEYTLIFS